MNIASSEAEAVAQGQDRQGKAGDVCAERKLAKVVKKPFSDAT